MILACSSNILSLDNFNINKNLLALTVAWFLKFIYEILLQLIAKQKLMNRFNSQTMSERQYENQ